MATKRSTAKWRQLLNRMLMVAVGCALLWFAVEGGEYGTRAVFEQHAKRAQLETEVNQLKQEVDSLQTQKIAVLKDDVVLERIAREQYGMLRGNRELLYWMNNSRSQKSDSARSH